MRSHFSHQSVDIPEKGPSDKNSRDRSRYRWDSAPSPSSNYRQSQKERFSSCDEGLAIPLAPLCQTVPNVYRKTPVHQIHSSRRQPSGRSTRGESSLVPKPLTRKFIETPAELQSPVPPIKPPANVCKLPVEANEKSKKKRSRSRGKAKKPQHGNQLPSYEEVMGNSEKFRDHNRGRQK